MTPEVTAAPEPFANPNRVAPRPLTVGDLRDFLNTQDIPDEIPVIIGGHDFGGNALSVGLADDIWADSGSLAGRLCIKATAAGLARV